MQRKSTIIDNRIREDISKNKACLDVPVTSTDIKNPLTYQDKAPRKPSLHIGQRKLFNNEFLFITDYLAHLDDAAIIVYAGAAPCNHVWWLHRLFPNIKFVLVDPNEFLIYLSLGQTHHKNYENKYTQYNACLNPETEHCDAIKYLFAGSVNMYKAGVAGPNGQKSRMITMLDENGKSIILDKDNAEDKKRIAEINSKLTTNLVERIQNSTARIFIIEDYMTLQLSKLLKCDLFISDIRTNLENKIPGDLDLIWNMSQQYNWIHYLKPDYSMLKFRAPFMRDADKIEVKSAIEKGEGPFSADFAESKNLGVDFLGDYFRGDFKYFEGGTYLQSWAGSNSSESRLITARDAPIVKYDIAHYENCLFQWNIERAFYCFKNPFALKTWGFDHCGDCALEAYGLNYYMCKYDTIIDLNEWLIEMKIATGGRDLKKHGHGFLFGWPTWQRVEEMRNEAAKFYKD